MSEKNKKPENPPAFPCNGKIYKFMEMDAKEPPGAEDNGGYVIAFVPFQGHQWCRYSSGSKTWQSIITMGDVNPTSWLKKIEEDIK